jgi:Ca2+-binding RTX toxin-like protein
MTVFYISPTGSGTHSGSSVANAGTIYDLPKFVAAAGAGDEVRLLADKGSYNVTKQMTISAGGAAGAPITIRGVSSSGEPMKATILGTRATDWKPGLSQGIELFRLVDGADHLKFSDLAVKNVGNGVFRIGADIENLAIERMAVTNVSRFIENHVSGSETSASVNGLKVADVTVSGYSQNAIRLKYNSRNVTLQNIVGDSMRQDGGLYIHGVMLDGTVHDVLLDHVTMKNNYGRGSSTDYWNGDGFCAEGQTYNLTFRDTVASGNTEAGYDIKASNVQMLRAVASGNSKNFRFWGENVTVVDSVSTNPQKYGGTGKPAHLHTGAGGATVTLDNFKYSDTSGTIKVFDLANGGSTITLVNMAMPDSDLILLDDGSTVKMLNDSAVYGTSGADTLNGGTGGDVLVGGKGNDTYLVNHTDDRPTEQSGEGTDLVKTTLASYTLGDNIENLKYVGSGSFAGTGNTLNNAITGGAGNDRLNGGTGNDKLTGGEGADTYVYDRGGKKDTIYNGDSGGADRLLFGSNIAEDQLWFGRSDSDLLVTLLGTSGSDTVRLKGWYSSSSNRLSKFQLSDGSVLTASGVNQLVQAMSAFTTSSGTPTSLTSAQEQSVETVIAANWQSPA